MFCVLSIWAGQFLISAYLRAARWEKRGRRKSESKKEGSVEGLRGTPRISLPLDSERSQTLNSISSLEIEDWAEEDSLSSADACMAITSVRMHPRTLHRYIP